MKPRLRKDIQFYYLNKFRERKNKDVRIRSGTKRTLNSNINKIESFIKDFQNNNGFQYYLDEINSEFQENFLEFLSESGESISTIRKSICTTNIPIIVEIGN